MNFVHLQKFPDSTSAICSTLPSSKCSQLLKHILFLLKYQILKVNRTLYRMYRMCFASIFLKEVTGERGMWILYSRVTKSQFQRKLNLFLSFFCLLISFHMFNICPSFFLTSPIPSKTHTSSQ